jgi:hypothetical protein
MNFTLFKEAVAQQFGKMCEHGLFRVDIDKDLLWSTYLESFPEGSNPIFRERREYDCSCCRQFIRAVGDVVTVLPNGEISSVWDISDSVFDIPAYWRVARAMSALIHSRSISNVFLSTERVAGTDRNFEQLTDQVLTWKHFFVNIPSAFVCRGTEIGPRLSETRALHDVLFRGLTEITDEAIDTVLELIAQNSLYRGEENRHAVIAFRDLKREFDAVIARNASDNDQHAFVWSRTNGLPVSVTKIHNTSIGTLLVNLSAGLDLDSAVRAFEAIVAPQNYKRPTALVTKKMVEGAKQTLGELGLISALERRYAKLSDISVNDILFADRSARKSVSDDVFDMLATRAINPKSLERVEEVSIETFIHEIARRAESMEILVENRHVGNLVSLVAPADPTANPLFKWPNKFSWSYNGDVTDSIKERVKQAGGNVTGDLCCRLAWNNRDDLDLHMIEPAGYEIHYMNRRRRSPCGGILDVDANGIDGPKESPVENIFYADRGTLPEGVYRLFVNQYAVRDPGKNVGFEAEIDYLGTVTRFAYPKGQRTGENVRIATFRYSKTTGVEFIESLPSTQASKTVWGLKTQEFQRVNILMLSPNYWGDRGIGNKHYFFMLDGCRNEGQARGFYNEFLVESLNAHRKVIEMVGAKMRTEDSIEQLSGLGFSSTQRNHALVKVEGAFTRIVKVQF